MLRILQVGLGDLGRKTVSDLHHSGLGRVTAAVDARADLAGRPLSDICAAATEGLVIAGSLAELEGLGDFDAAVVMTRSHLPDCAELFRELLKAGLTVVSTCEELVWPWLRHPGLALELDGLARAHGGRLLGAGVNPGFLMDLLPGLLSSACLELDSVRVERRIDASDRRAAFQEKIGAGLGLEQMQERLDSGTGGHVGLGESLHLLASLCGFELEDWSEEGVAIPAVAELESAAGTLAPGAAAGIRQVVRGSQGGETVLELVFDARLEQPDPADDIRLEGRPRLELQIPGGLHGDLATSAIVLHSIAALRALASGLATMGDLALSRRRAPRP